MHFLWGIILVIRSLYRYLMRVVFCTRNDQRQAEKPAVARLEKFRPGEPAALVLLCIMQS